MTQVQHIFPLFIHHCPPLYHRPLRAYAEPAAGVYYYNECILLLALLLSLIRPRVSMSVQRPRHRPHPHRNVFSQILVHICVCHTMIHIAGLYSTTPSFARKTSQYEPVQRHNDVDHARRSSHILVYDTGLYNDDDSTPIHITSPDENAKSRQRHWSPTTVFTPLSNT